MIKDFTDVLMCLFVGCAFGGSIAGPAGLVAGGFIAGAIGLLCLRES